MNWNGSCLVGVVVTGLDDGEDVFSEEVNR